MFHVKNNIGVSYCLSISFLIILDLHYNIWICFVNNFSIIRIVGGFLHKNHETWISMVHSDGQFASSVLLLCDPLIICILSLLIKQQNVNEVEEVRPSRWKEFLSKN